MFSGQSEQRDRTLARYALWSAVCLFTATGFDVYVDVLTLGWVFPVAQVLAIAQLGYISLLRSRVRQRLSDRVALAIGALMIACSLPVFLVAAFRILNFFM